MTYVVYPERIPGFILNVLQAFPTTMVIMFATLAISLVLGFLVALAQLSKKRWAQVIARGWISFMRGIPALVMIFLLYFALPQVLLATVGINIASATKMNFIIAALSLIASANMGEMMRSAYLTVPKTQMEACLAVGMTPAQAVRRVILPQAVVVAIPLFGNNLIMLFKETSLAFSIGVIDMMGRANVVSAANYGAYRLELYVAVAVIYWVVCVVIMLVFAGLERGATRSRRPARA
ncbi:MAG: amino acid ABC transporter permease [Coriobacteriia bacterium]|nr:amino acid ABC transporter permease [Coriobacteriia bacterium]MBS5477240.1 amino acid ABC transporter permease [Coriobacteriia bacterium]